MEPLILQHYAAEADRLLGQRCRQWHISTKSSSISRMPAETRNTQESYFENSRRAWHSKLPTEIGYTVSSVSSAFGGIMVGICFVI
jgi:hypothetical protein